MTCRSPSNTQLRGRLGPSLRRGLRGLWLAVVLGLLVPGLTPLPVAASAIQAEADRLKSAFIYKFALFVSWPGAARGNAEDPFRFCVMGRASLADALGVTVAGRTAHGRPLEVIGVASEKDATECHVLFVDAEASARFRGLVPNLAGKQTLTIGEASWFVAAGGIISLIEDGSRLSFEINPDALADSGLRASSQLLRLGRRAARTVPASAAPEPRP